MLIVTLVGVIMSISASEPKSVAVEATVKPTVVNDNEKPVAVEATVKPTAVHDNTKSQAQILELVDQLLSSSGRSGTQNQKLLLIKSLALNLVL